MLVVSRNAEARLVEMLGEIEDQRDSWTVIFFNLHLLLDQYRSDYQLKIAVNLAMDLLADLEGSIFSFEDGGLAVMCRHLNTVVMNKLIFQLRYLYMDDPLAYGEDGTESRDFCMAFRLFSDWQACMDFASRRMMKTARNTAGKRSIAEGGEKAKQKFSASSMATVEKNLSMLGLSGAIRRQAICALKKDGEPPKRVFDELYVHISHLRQLLRVDYDFFSNRWLFKYLTQLLDQRMFVMLQTAPDQYLSRPVSINVNSESLLSDYFREFDESIEPAQKVSVVFEVNVVDAFADMAAFSYARDYVQERGYRICIDGLTNESLLHVDRSRLKADLIKLQWNADVKADLGTPENQQLIHAVEQCGANRIILCRCDNKQAVDYGQALKISLFQGRYLDRLMNPDSSVSN